MFSFLPLIALAGTLLQNVNGATVEHWWNISYATVNPDGLHQRRVLGVNGTWPPPPINVNQNDTLRIHAYNGIPEPTTLHSHGLFFNRTAHFDGAAGVTQCGIPPGASFTYEIPVDMQTGTYWIHSHYKGQYVEGFRTPFIVHLAVELHRYDEEFTVVLGDWYHEDYSVLLKRFMHKFNPTGAEPVPNSALLYIAQNGTYLPSSTAISTGEAVGKNVSLPFEPGKTYRLRLINMSALAMFWFWIEGHIMRVTEVDGTDVAEYETPIIPLTAAQRYSILVTALNDTSRNWPINANMDPRMFDLTPDDLQLNVTAQIKYSSSATLQNSTIWPGETYPEFNETQLVPLVIESSAPPDVSHTLNASFEVLTDGINHGMFNKAPYIPPIVPSLFTQLTMGQDANNVTVYGAQTRPYILNHMEMVYLTIYNEDAGFHPFHLHGHKFQVLHRSINVSSDDPSVNPPFVPEQSNPVRRDTVQVPPDGSVTIAFRADNPGAWILHCHVEWHLESGLAVVFLEAPTMAQRSISPPRYLTEQCAALGIPSSGNAAGRNSTWDLRGAPEGPYQIKLGWTPRAKGALAGCVITALLGLGTIVWYGMGGLIEDEEEAEEEERARLAKRENGIKARALRKVGGVFEGVTARN